MQWTDSPALAAGVKVCILYGDMKKAEPIGFRIKIPAGGIIAPHTHPVHERVTVISGAFAMGEGEKFDKAALKELPVGSVAIFPKGCPMFGFAQGRDDHPGERRRPVGDQLRQPRRRSRKK